jgi:hypothetical protein
MAVVRIPTRFDTLVCTFEQDDGEVLNPVIGSGTIVKSFTFN